MSRIWNGLSLQTELSTLLSDTSTAFKSKVLGWMNDVQDDICSSHDWAFMRKHGKKVLTASTEIQTLTITAPTAPTVVIAAGGSLTNGSVYTVLVTFYEGTQDVESIAGTASSSVTATAVNKTITVTGIPLGAGPLTTARKLYLVKDGGAPLFSATISDNTTTTASITTESSSTIEAPDFDNIRQLDDVLYLESSDILKFSSVAQMRLTHPGTFGDGTPSEWGDLGYSKILIYPRPSTALTLSFYYYKNPNRIYAASTSQPDMPVWMKQVLKAGVIAMGYEYRDREGQQVKRQNYEALLKDTISKKGDTFNGSYRIRDVVGDSDGWEV